MTNEKYVPSKAQILSDLVGGYASVYETSAAVQRSHRFPSYLFTQIENLARLGKVPVSLIINQLIECGLEAVKKELPEETAKQLTFSTQAQVDRPTKNYKVDVKGRNLPPRKKPKAGK